MTESVRGPAGLWPEDDGRTNIPEEELPDLERDETRVNPGPRLGADRDLQPELEGDEPILDDPNRIQFGGRSG